MGRKVISSAKRLGRTAGGDTRVVNLRRSNIPYSTMHAKLASQPTHQPTPAHRTRVPWLSCGNRSRGRASLPRSLSEAIRCALKMPGVNGVVPISLRTGYNIQVRWGTLSEDYDAERSWVYRKRRIISGLKSSTTGPIHWEVRFHAGSSLRTASRHTLFERVLTF